MHRITYAQLRCGYQNAQATLGACADGIALVNSWARECPPNPLRRPGDIACGSKSVLRGDSARVYDVRRASYCQTDRHGEAMASTRPARWATLHGRAQQAFCNNSHTKRTKDSPVRQPTFLAS